MKIFVYKTLFIFVCIFVFFQLTFGAKIKQLNNKLEEFKSQENINYMKNKLRDVHFEVLRKVKKLKSSSQREMANSLDMSLGKLNYLIQELKSKGLVKIENFKKNPNKKNYLYILTPKGVKIYTNLALNFLKRKMREYDELQKEIDEN